MKKRILNSTLFKASHYLILLFILVGSSCGIKHSINKVYNVENNTTKTQKATTSCQFVQLTNEKSYQEVTFKKVQFFETKFAITSVEYSEEANSNSFFIAGSIPLYILYKQLRSDLI